MGFAETLRASIGKLLGTVGHGRPADPNIDARYEAAQNTPAVAGFWANTDRLDADSANSPEVRAQLVARSRYEDANNPIYNGIASTFATDVVGSGPNLRMTSSDPEFDREVEREWAKWSKAIDLRQKLVTMARAKHVDGEGWGIARENPKVKHRVKLSVQLYETEQIATPGLFTAEPGRISGIQFDQYGNPESYDILRNHPGGPLPTATEEPEKVEAKYVLHWFKRTRPAQSRGIPECTSALNVSVQAKRWREAVLGAAEMAADFAIVMKTQMPADQEGLKFCRPFEQVKLTPKMMTALPVGTDIAQVKAEQPHTSYSDFNRSLVAEMARPKSMPYNRAACDSSGSNYASGRLDYLVYYSELDNDRADCDDQVLIPLFHVWFEEAVLEFGWTVPEDYTFSFGWPRHNVIDIVSEATAHQLQLQTGELTLGDLYAANGQDYEESLERMAREYGVEVDEMRKFLLIANFNTKSQQASFMTAETNAAKKEQEGRDASAATAA